MWWSEKQTISLQGLYDSVMYHSEYTTRKIDRTLEVRIEKLSLVLLCFGIIFIIHFVIPWLKKSLKECNFVSVMLRIATRIPIIGYYINRYVKNEIRVAYNVLHDLLYQHRDKIYEKFPDAPLKLSTIESHIQRLHKLHHKVYASGLHSGTIYHRESEEFNELMENAMSRFTDTTGFEPENYKGVSQMNSDIISAAKKLFHCEDGHGLTTFGGTESITCAILAYKFWAREVKGVTKPNLVIYETLHAAFPKACFLFDIECRIVKVNPDGTGNPKDLEKHIDSNTIAVAGSACNYAHGTIDDIKEIAKIALNHNIGCHVDNCLGGFVNCFMDYHIDNMVPFDFRVPGVTSTSVDTHKYGYGPKGMSVLLLRPKKLFDYLKFTSVDHSGALFSTSNTGGARAGAIVAGTWAAFAKIGKQGYINKTKKIYDTTLKIRDEIEKIDDVALYGPNNINMICFDGAKNGVTAGAISSKMRINYDWHLSECQRPYVCHYLVMDSNVEKADKFIKDFKDSVQRVKDEDGYQKSSQQALYGITSLVTDRNVLDKLIYLFVDGTYATRMERAKLSDDL